MKIKENLYSLEIGLTRKLKLSVEFRVSVQGVKSLWGDCMFIIGGHSSRFVLFYSFHYKND